ncbi:transposase [Grimontia sp. NTOU-MAR1]|uniref:transposase n=1 Tax=Grimontia sp. NTOU-MAR1 TaxID=3111011 RepID=UPI003FA379A0
MKRPWFTESQISSILREVDSGKTVDEICRNHGLRRTTFCNWQYKYGEDCKLEKIIKLEAENTQLRKKFTDVSSENHKLRKLLANKKMDNE